MIWKCEKCGRSVRVPDTAGRISCHCVRPIPREPTNCLHFLGPTGDQTESAKCGGCQTATAMTAVAECELHGLVTFIHRAKDEAFKCCKNCKDFEPSP